MIHLFGKTLFNLTPQIEVQIFMPINLNIILPKDEFCGKAGNIYLNSYTYVIAGVI